MSYGGLAKTRNVSGNLNTGRRIIPILMVEVMNVNPRKQVSSALTD